jgi:hypothetical protein
VQLISGSFLRSEIEIKIPSPIYYPIVSQVEIRSICPLGERGAQVSKERDDYKRMLEQMFEGGTLSAIDRPKLLADYDAAKATSRMPVYAFISTAIAAISAIASAAAAYFSYASLHIPH